MMNVNNYNCIGTGTYELNVCQPNVLIVHHDWEVSFCGCKKCNRCGTIQYRNNGYWTYTTPILNNSTNAVNVPQNKKC